MSRPRYRRKGRMDIVARQWVPFTAEELRQDAINRRLGWAVAGFIVLLLVAGLAVFGIWVISQAAQS